MCRRRSASWPAPRAIPAELVILDCDGAASHTTQATLLPENTRILTLPHTPSSIRPKQLWELIRERWFSNIAHKSMQP